MRASRPVRVARPKIPRRLASYFQEYNVKTLDFARDANLIIERTLEFGTWREVGWLLRVYGSKRIARYVRESGERNLSPDAFNFWRKMFRLKAWNHSPFQIARGEIWQH